jgi:chromate transporter
VEQPKPLLSTESDTPPSSTKSSPPEEKKTPPTLGAIFEVFLTCGAVSFGGGVVAYLRDYLIEGAHMLDDEEFLASLEISQSIPGLIALNMSVVVGDTLRGIPGALVALAGMMLPGTALVMTLGILWQSQGHNSAVSGFLLGVAAAAVGLLTVTFIHIGKKQLSQLPDAIIVLLTFLASGIFRLPLWMVFVTIAPLSIWLYRPMPHRMKKHPGEHLPFHRGERHHHLVH